MTLNAHTANRKVLCQHKHTLGIVVVFRLVEGGHGSKSVPRKSRYFTQDMPLPMTASELKSQEENRLRSDCTGFISKWVQDIID